MKEERKIKKTPKESLRDPTGQVKCPIFQSKNEEIGGITKAINEAENIERKALFAERLIKEAKDLLSCEHFDEKKIECKFCHYIANLRKKTANLILKTSPR